MIASGKELTTKEVLYVKQIKNNLVSGWLLKKHEFYIVFEFNKIVLTKKGMFVGKCYVYYGIFKFHVMANKLKFNEITLLLTCLSVLMCEMLNLLKFIYVLLSFSASL